MPVRLHQLQDRMNFGKYWYRPKETEKGFVFTSRLEPGKPTSHSNWQYRIRAILKFCPDLPPIHPHSFRHTHASLLAEAGVPMDEIADRLGHAGNGTTRKIYLHVTSRRRKDAAEKFAIFMGE